MNDVVTYCSDCDFPRASKKDDPPWRWYCSQHPRRPEFGFVSDGQTTTPIPPFLRCVDVNGGLCRLFAPKRNGQIELLP